MSFNMCKNIHRVRVLLPVSFSPLIACFVLRVTAGVLNPNEEESRQVIQVCVRSPT